jgi:hypothetical protein
LRRAFGAEGHLPTFGFLHQTLEIKRTAASFASRAPDFRTAHLPGFRMEVQIAAPSASEL